MKKYLINGGRENMRKKGKIKTWKRYIFEDQYTEECKGMSKEEIAHREAEHGKLVEVIPFEWRSA